MEVVYLVGVVFFTIISDALLLTVDSTDSNISIDEKGFFTEKRGWQLAFFVKGN